MAINLSQGGGGVLRDNNGTFLLAYAWPLKNNTINEVEGITLLWWIKFSIHMNINLQEIEEDSKVVVEAIKRRASIISAQT